MSKVVFCDVCNDITSELAMAQDGFVQVCSDSGSQFGLPDDGEPKWLCAECYRGEVVSLTEEDAKRLLEEGRELQDALRPRIERMQHLTPEDWAYRVK